MNRIRVGLVGAGFVAPMHVRGWRLAGAEVAAITSRDRVSAEERARSLGISRVFPSAASMLDAGIVDVLDVVSPPSTHREYVLAALDRGLAVMCQKPLAGNLEDARAIARASAGARVMVHENWRFRSWYRALRELLSAGELGPVHWARFSSRFAGTVTTSRHPDVPHSIGRQPFFATMQPFLLLESVIHQIDVSRFLFGEPTHVYSRLHRVSDQVRGEDCVLVVLGYPDRTVVLERSYAAKGYPDPPAISEEVAVEGTRGSAFIDRTGRLTVAIDTPDEAHRRVAHEPSSSAYEDSYAAAIRSFVDAIRAGDPVETPPEDNLRTLGLVFAAYHSARTGSVVAGADLGAFVAAPAEVSP